MSGTPNAEASPRSVRPGYLLAFLGSLVGMFALYYGVLLTLSATGNLPPPAFTNSLCIDEKFDFLRRERLAEPNLLVVGSSVAWRHFDGRTLVRDAPGLVPLNGGLCGLSVNQTAYATAWLLDHYKNVQDVVMITAPQDFDGCTGKPTAFFDRADVDDYVFGDASPWFYYTRYFSLVSLTRNASQIAGRRSGADKVDPLVFDQFGSGPLGTDGGRGELLYGEMKQPDPACLTALSQLAARLHEEGRRLFVAVTPMHPQWRQRHDPDGRLLRRFAGSIRTALNGHGAQVWDSNQSLALNDWEFFDAIHLRWIGVPRFTEALVRAFDMTAAQATPGVQSSLVLNTELPLQASDRLVTD
ncbi:hypothetical protein [Belnapia rosea]|uniref:D-alanine transfer protein n=1 Tax=Belnapia rosea TaxID=938405 RepID=A0A1G6S1K5_9PROT|nr:hypothetical protein [Belnapia rosea]SDB72040.1 hypothetical protein SAMN02927895_04293 [Belnapia rosea]SDD10047.1 hypothetical protein SAMN04487779_1004206 [Belnapia rosea]